jgi:hypothetical protein
MTDDTQSLSDEPHDYWEQQFRAADERAALLAEASVPELVELYLVSHEDWEFGSMVFEALQRRPKAGVRAAGWRELESPTSKRRAFGVRLLSMHDQTQDDLQILIPVFVRLLRDPDVDVVCHSLSAIGSAQLQFVSEVFTQRVRSLPDDRYNPAWEDSPLPSVVDLGVMAPLICHSNPEVRNSVPHSLQFCGEVDATAILLGRTWDSDEDV